jgi:hypothetical protein
MIGGSGSGLGLAYAQGLEKLSEEKGYELSLIVKAVIVAKMMSEMVKNELNKLSDDEASIEKIESLIVEVVSEIIATMCTLQNKEFRKDIVPLVAQVMEVERNLQ